ncbi:MAG: hypothetical protein IT366_10845 [Candidatus Hydrogenedentes bacterium]|nr:hypothetical protein [Candidatus Hydrogenedentota bacterium]
MKLLQIDNNLGLFLVGEDKYDLIENVTKDDLLRLVDLALSVDVEFDEYDEKLVKNPAHQIIYKSVYEKLKGLQERKKAFLDESERQYLEEYEKYKNELSDQNAGS